MSPPVSPSRAGLLAGQLAATWTVFKKELIDALRDRRTLMMVIISSVLVGPAVLVALSNLIGGIERQAEGREVLVAGLERAPSLRNYIERQTFSARAAPADHEGRIRSGTLGEPVLVVPPDFEAALAEGRMPEVVLLYNSTNTRAQASVPRMARLLQGFNSERATLHLVARQSRPGVRGPAAAGRVVRHPLARVAVGENHVEPARDAGRDVDIPAFRGALADRSRVAAARHTGDRTVDVDLAQQRVVLHSAPKATCRPRDRARQAPRCSRSRRCSTSFRPDTIDRNSPSSPSTSPASLIVRRCSS